MANIFVECEGDIDFSVNHCIELAKTGRLSHMTLAFPSDLLYNTFIDTLYETAAKCGVSELNLEVDIVLPPKENNDGKCTGGGGSSPSS